MPRRRRSCRAEDDHAAPKTGRGAEHGQAALKTGTESSGSSTRRWRPSCRAEDRHAALKRL